MFFILLDPFLYWSNVTYLLSAGVGVGEYCSSAVKDSSFALVFQTSKGDPQSECIGTDSTLRGLRQKDSMASVP